MSDQEIKDIWMNADDGDRIHLNLPDLLANLKGKMKKMDRVLFFRDAREIVAAVLVLLFFGYQANFENIPIVKLCNVLIACWAVYVIYRLLEVRKYKKISDLSNSLKAQLEQQKIYLQQQAQLLDSALLWYIAPPAVLGMMSVIGRSFATEFKWGAILFSLFIFGLVGGGVYLLNKKAAKTAYQPLLENIDSVLLQLDENSK